MCEAKEAVGVYRPRQPQETPFYKLACPPKPCRRWIVAFTCLPAGRSREDRKRSGKDSEALRAVERGIRSGPAPNFRSEISNLRSGGKPTVAAATSVKRCGHLWMLPFVCKHGKRWEFPSESTFQRRSCEDRTPLWAVDGPQRGLPRRQTPFLIVYPAFFLAPIHLQDLSSKRCERKVLSISLRFLPFLLFKNAFRI